MNGYAALEDLVQDILVRSLFLTLRRLSVTVYICIYGLKPETYPACYVSYLGLFGSTNGRAG